MPQVLLKVSIYTTTTIMFPAFLDCYETNHNLLYFHVLLALHIYFIVMLFSSDCVPACVFGSCNSSVGVCECSFGYSDIDCSGKFMC